MTDLQRIRVLIVDDHEMVRDGLKSLLDDLDEFDVVGTASSGIEAIELCSKLRPNVILMDVLMPRMGGIAATSEIHKLSPEVKIIMLTGSDDSSLAVDALKVGTTGFLSKTTSVRELATAIRAAYAGKPTLSPEALHALIHASQSPEPLPNVSLSNRERDVLKLMAKGMNNADIAKQLVISHSTVKFHVSSILSKLGVHTRTEAVTFALQQRLF